MASAVVVDSSVVIKWLVHEEGSDLARALRTQWIKADIFPSAPDFLLVELHSIIWKNLRLGLLQTNDPLVGQTPTFGLDLNWAATTPLLSSAFLLAIKYQASIYDSLYVALAQSLQAPFFTADQSLAAKLTGSGIIVHVVS
jgi:predicted nucleic acid-binding protein